MRPLPDEFRVEVILVDHVFDAAEMSSGAGVVNPFYADRA